MIYLDVLRYVLTLYLYWRFNKNFQTGDQIMKIKGIFGDLQAKFCSLKKFQMKYIK